MLKGSLRMDSISSISSGAGAGGGGGGFAGVQEISQILGGCRAFFRILAVQHYGLFRMRGGWFSRL